MSDSGEKVLLAGHAPATIVGGMRVPGHHHPHTAQDINNNSNKNANKDEGKEENAKDESVEEQV